MPEPETVLLLGEDHVAYGAHACTAAPGGLLAASISVGARPDAPSARTKYDPNEDALVARDAGDAVLVAVADAHWGRGSSHRLVRRIAESLLPGMVRGPTIARALQSLADPRPEPDDPSETTLLMAAFHRGTGLGFGISFGDSSLAVLEPGRPARIPMEKSAQFVTPALPESLAAHRARRCAFRVPRNGLLVAFTDGVDECHYGHPESSVRPRHLEALLETVGPEPQPFARRLVELALAGVDGHPGGEDNIALIVAAR